MSQETHSETELVRLKNELANLPAWHARRAPGGQVTLINRTTYVQITVDAGSPEESIRQALQMIDCGAGYELVPLDESAGPTGEWRDFSSREWDSKGWRPVRAEVAQKSPLRTLIERFLLNPGIVFRRRIQIKENTMKIEQLPIEQTYGYHVFLGIDAPTPFQRDSDEFWDAGKGCFTKILAAGTWFSVDIYRRKIDVGAGFELVPLDAPVAEGWEFLQPPHATWRPVYYNPARPCLWTSPRNYFSQGCWKVQIVWRRRINKQEPKPDANGWFKLSDCLPTAFPCEVFGPKGEVRVSTAKYAIGTIGPVGWPQVEGYSVTEDRQLTHWKHLPVSMPPVVEQTPVEKAWENYRECAGPGVAPVYGIRLFKAGWKAAEQHRNEIVFGTDSPFAFDSKPPVV